MTQEEIYQQEIFNSYFEQPPYRYGVDEQPYEDRKIYNNCSDEASNIKKILKTL